MLHNNLTSIAAGIKNNSKVGGALACMFTLLSLTSNQRNVNITVSYNNYNIFELIILILTFYISVCVCVCVCVYNIN